MKLQELPLGFLVIFSLLFSSLIEAQELSSSAVKRARNASVEVHIKGQLRGGGAMVRGKNGTVYVVTAAHLFHSPKDTCSILVGDQKTYFASLSAYDLGHDLALLEIDQTAAKQGVIPIAGAIPGETQPVFNLGPALRRRTLVLPGRVADSRICYTDFSSSKGHIAHFFVSGINPVMTSGGMWINESGALVGIQHGRLIGDKGAPSSGLSMVSPPSAIRDLLNKREIGSTPGLGGYVWELWTADRKLLDKVPEGLQGLVINPVIEGRPFHTAGIKAGEIILTCDGKPMQRRHELLSLIRSKPVGSTFSFQLLNPESRTSRSLLVKTDRLESHWD